MLAKLDSRTYISQEEKFMTGSKAGEDRQTLLLACNVEGHFKRKLLLVYQPEDPRPLKSHNKNPFPVIWKSNL